MLNLFEYFSSDQRDRILADGLTQFREKHPEVTEGLQLKMILWASSHAREIIVAALEYVMENAIGIKKEERCPLCDHTKGKKVNGYTCICENR